MVVVAVPGGVQRRGSLVGLQGSGSLRPELPCLCEACLFPLFRMWLLYGWHRCWWGHSRVVLRRRWQWRPAGCANLPFLAGWLWHVLFPRCSSPAPRVRRGVVLRAGSPGVWWLFDLRLFALVDRHPGPGINTGTSGCRRLGRGKSMGLAHLAFHEDLCGQQSCWLVLTASATLCVCWRCMLQRCAELKNVHVGNVGTLSHP